MLNTEPHRKGFKGQGYDANGRIIGGRHAADYYVEASFPGQQYNPETKQCEAPSPWPTDNGEAEARAWAIGAFARNPRLASINLTGTAQRWEGTSWTTCAPYFTITREEAEQAAVVPA